MPRSDTDNTSVGRNLRRPWLRAREQRASELIPIVRSELERLAMLTQLRKHFRRDLCLTFRQTRSPAAPRTGDRVQSGQLVLEEPPSVRAHEIHVDPSADAQCPHYRRAQS